MTALAHGRRALVRGGKLLPLARLLVIGELAVQAGRHVAKLEPPQRARLLTLLRRAARHPRALSEGEREELIDLIARTEPRAFLGSAATRLSPIPVPRPLIEGGARTVARTLRRRR